MPAASETGAGSEGVGLGRERHVVNIRRSCVLNREANLRNDPFITPGCDRQKGRRRERDTSGEVQWQNNRNKGALVVTASVATSPPGAFRRQ